MMLLGLMSSRRLTCKSFLYLENPISPKCHFPNPFVPNSHPGVNICCPTINVFIEMISKVDS